MPLPASAPTAPLPRTLHLVPHHSETITRLIVEIVQLLMVSSPSDPSSELKRQLESLQQIIALTGLAIQAYEHTPLGRSLAQDISVEAEGCRLVLQELLGTINQCRNGLQSTRIAYLWRPVWWSHSDLNILAVLKARLLRLTLVLSSMFLNKPSNADSKTSVSNVFCRDQFTVNGNLMFSSPSHE